MDNRVLFAAAFLLAFTGSAAADVPEVTVSPNLLTKNWSAGHEHRAEFTFENNDTGDRVLNMTVPDTKYWNITPNKFDINASSTYTVEAVFYGESQNKIGQELNSTYYYGGSDNDFSGPALQTTVDLFYRSTSVTVQPFRRTFQDMELGESASSVFRVENTGNETAYNVEVNGSENVELGKTGQFNLTSGEAVIVRYNVTIPTPETNKTAATNQTYTFDVEASAANSEISSFSAEAFVPFKQYDSIKKQKDVIEQLQKIQQFCQQDENEDLAICGSDVVKYRNRTKIINNTPQANVTLTEDELRSLKTIANKTDLGIENLVHRMKLQQNTIRHEQNQTRQVLKDIASELKERNRQQASKIRDLNQSLTRVYHEEQQEDKRRGFWGTVQAAVLGFLIISSGIYVGVQKLNERSGDTRI